MHAVRTTIFHALFFLLFAVLQLASASIYPTLPVQGTVWTAGQSVLVTWADNGIPPTVNTMGPVTIEIWANLNVRFTIHTGTAVLTCILSAAIVVIVFYR